MIPADYEATRTSIMDHEGFSPKPVPDTIGFVVGFGHNFETDPITRLQAGTLLDEDLAERIVEVSTAWPPFSTVAGPCQRVVLEMSYQIGVEGLLGFKDLLHACATGNREAAAQAVLASQLAKQTPSRVADYAAILREPA